MAKEKFLENIPDALNSLFGDRNAVHGSIKVFEVLQDIRLNKHAFYSLLEVFLYEVFPEIPRPRLRNTSASPHPATVPFPASPNPYSPAVPFPFG